MTLGDDALACARELVGALVEGGVREASVSPGSRSTPIALALWREPAIRVHVHLDERSSAFFALGLAKASRRPVAVVTTSGTAAAECFPAVVEASQSRVRLVMLTADRPPRLRGTGANQTIDQRELYGDYARGWFEPPVAGLGVEEDWRRAGEEAVSAGVFQPSGPVHLNLPFEEPLVPSAPGVDRSPAVEALVEKTHVAPLVVPEGLPRAVSGVRGLLVAGPQDAPATGWMELTRRLGWPVLAEPLSGLRIPGALAAGQSLIRSSKWLESYSPDVVVQIGAAPTSRATQRLVVGARELIVIDRDHLDPDPERKAKMRAPSDPEVVAGWLGQRDIEPAPDGWLEAWSEADSAAREALDRTVDSWPEPFEPRIARDLADAIPREGVLFVGNSSPVRDLDLAMRPRGDLRVMANRGASGIDGLVSTALGIAANGSPTFALLGDLSILHDLGALAWNSRKDTNATIVVLDNGGGALFAQLPQRSLPEFNDLFITPHGADLTELASAAGAAVHDVTKADELGPALEEATEQLRLGLVRVAIDAGLDRARREELDSAVAEALDAIGP